MKKIDYKIKAEIMAKVAQPENLIGDVADDYGIPRRTVYQWIKASRKLDKRTKAMKETKLKTKLEKLSGELSQLQSVAV